VLLSLALGAALAATVALAGTAREAEATFPGTNARIAFDSTRTSGTGVDNPTGDYEIFTIKPDGTGLKQITHNTTGDVAPAFSPDGTKIAYYSVGDPISNPEGDTEIYRMNTLEGTGKKNLTSDDANDSHPDFSPDGQKIAYQSWGAQNSNPEGDFEVYRMNFFDGSAQTNLTNDLATDGAFVIRIGG
jgi:Tol biopolymer transport system component